MEHWFLQNQGFRFFNATQKIILMLGIKCVFGIFEVYNNENLLNNENKERILFVQICLDCS